MEDPRKQFMPTLRPSLQHPHPSLILRMSEPETSFRALGGRIPSSSQPQGAKKRRTNTSRACEND
jgi:hypothetical protein